MEAQDVVIQQVEQQANEVREDTEKGHQQLAVAKEHAKKARKGRKWCCIILSVILVSLLPDPFGPRH